MSRVIELGVEFAGVSYFDGQGFLTRHDRGLVSAQQLDGLKVCVQSGTTSEANLDYYLKNLEIKADKKTEAKMNELTTDEDGQEKSSSFGILKSR